MDVFDAEFKEPFWVEKVSEDDDLFTLKEWKEARSSNAIAPYDGSGYWSNGTHYSYDYDCFGPKPEWATHVVWFNK